MKNERRMIAGYGKNPYAGLRLSVCDDNYNLPRHRWYQCKEAFSETLVRVALEDLGPRRGKVRILDPFAGSGTTLVAAGRMGVSALGIEVNPFLEFVCRAKCARKRQREFALRRTLDDILRTSRCEIRSPVEGQSTFTDGSGKERWLFNRSVIRGFAAIDRAIEKSGREYRGALRLALFASLMECCNAKRDGKCLRYRKDWRLRGFNSSDLRAEFELRAGTVIEDLVRAEFEVGGIRSLRGDARGQLKRLKTGSVDIVVTSPPYLNSFDYSDTYRPELFVGGFVRSNEELRRIRIRTIRSHIQVGWKPATEIASPLLQPLLNQFGDRKLWDARIPGMIQSYFADIDGILLELQRIVSRHGKAWIVVSTSAYAGLEVPVDLILADIAARRGWTLQGVHVLRQLRASGQQWNHLGPGEGPPLRESLIVLKRDVGK